jgi:hypothetical protein
MSGETPAKEGVCSLRIIYGLTFGKVEAGTAGVDLVIGVNVSERLSSHWFFLSHTLLHLFPVHGTPFT